MKNLRENIVSIFGSIGEEWLNNLPVTISKIADDYNLKGLVPVNNMTFNYIASGYKENKPIILKIYINNKDLEWEAASFNSFNSNLIPKLYIVGDNFIIMQKAIPGKTLKSFFPLQERKAAIIICNLIKTLNSSAKVVNYKFSHIKDLLSILDRDLDIPDNILFKARNLRNKLLESSSEDVLLHGDLHHDNILRNSDSWMVIDPKGYIGDPIFEVTAYLCNPFPYLVESKRAKDITDMRIVLLSKELNISEQRIREWLYVKIVLCWAWSLDDNLDCKYWSKLIELV